MEKLYIWLGIGVGSVLVAAGSELFVGTRSIQRYSWLLSWLIPLSMICGGILMILVAARPSFGTFEGRVNVFINIVLIILAAGIFTNARITRTQSALPQLVLQWILPGLILGVALLSLAIRLRLLPSREPMDIIVVTGVGMVAAAAMLFLLTLMGNLTFGHAQHLPASQRLGTSFPQKTASPLNQQQVREVQTLVLQGKKIQAVKQVRTITGMSVRDATDYVDSVSRSEDM